MRVALVLLIALALSGCFGKGPSQSEMQRELEAAIVAFPADVSPQGGLASIKVTGDVSVESQFNGVPVMVTIQPRMEVTLGRAGDVLVTGKAASLVFTAYCSSERIIAIVTGGEQVDIPDTSAAARNPLGICTGRGSEAILEPYFEFPMVDPSLMTGDLRLEKMTPQGFEDLGKGMFAGTFTTEGEEGTTTLTITAKDGHITKIVSQNPSAHLKLDMTYGDRVTITPPEADHKVTSFVVGTTKSDENGWTWKGTSVEGGPYEEYTIRVYPEATSVGCGTSVTPTVSFDLGDGTTQEKDGWRMVLFEDKDGTLGQGDEIIVRQPGFGQSFSHVVTIHDDWADETATYSCSIPGPTPLLGVAGLLAAFMLRRR